MTSLSPQTLAQELQQAAEKGPSAAAGVACSHPEGFSWEEEPQAPFKQVNVCRVTLTGTNGAPD